MRFQVPQFIEVEDKIFGPFTFKQFVYLGGGAGLCVIIYSFTPKLIAFPLMLAAAGLSGALAFFKFNNKPFLNLIESFFKYVVGGKLYVWKKIERKAKEEAAAAEVAPQVYVPKLGDSRLKDLTWSLDVKENVNPVTPNEGKTA